MCRSRFFLTLGLRQWPCSFRPFCLFVIRAISHQIICSSKSTVTSEKVVVHIYIFTTINFNHILMQLIPFTSFKGKPFRHLLLLDLHCLERPCTIWLTNVQRHCRAETLPCHTPHRANGTARERLALL